MKAVRVGSAVPQKAAHVHALFASAAAVRWNSYASVLENRLQQLVRAACYVGHCVLLTFAEYENTS